MKWWLFSFIVLPHAPPPGWITWSGLLSGLLWLGLSALTAAVGVLFFTRWRPWRPLKKCLVISVLLHLWLVMGLSTVPIPPVPPLKGAQEICVTLEGLEECLAGGQAPSREPAEQTTLGGSSPPVAWRETPAVAPVPLPRDANPQTALVPTTLAQTSDQAQAPADASGLRRGKLSQEKPGVSDLSELSPAHVADRVPQLDAQPETAEPAPATAGLEDQGPRWRASTIPDQGLTGRPSAQASHGSDTAVQVSAETPGDSRQIDASVRRDEKGLESPPARIAEATLGTFGHRPPADMQPLSVPSSPEPIPHPIPLPYRWRIAPDRLALAKRFGASEESENAVKQALDWLAANQDPDGRWNPRRHGAGEERFESGRDRQGAGKRADTGVTGLAVLAFAASGHTHQQGPYAATVQKAIKFLLDVQGPDGNLGGPAATYEFMYCHGIATLALSEILGLSGDRRLRDPVASAVAYTVASQDPWGGGWRYRPQEAGDTSQLGWQLMALRSAELAGISVPRSVWDAASRYLDTVSAGTHGGLASYRPGDRATRTMTAEALVCRQLLGLSSAHPAAREAGDFLLGELPGEGVPNRYYWYYATMAMYQLQGSHWELWNRALQRTLLATQRRDGPLAGSWDPTTRWDGYGGRVYATALATLCLEAYYRFLPLVAAGQPDIPPLE